MRKLMFVVVLLGATLILSSCGPIVIGPETPADTHDYCVEMYQEMLLEHPDYPKAFIGACVSFWQTGKTNAFVSLCGYEPFWQDMMDGNEGLVITSRQECMDFIRNYESE